MRTKRSPFTGTARRLRSDSTDAERQLWYRLRGRRLEGFKFRRQFAIGSYVVDFACLERKLIVELDGGQHAEQIDHDELRTRLLEARRFRVLRFWNDEALRETEAVLEVILSELRQSPSPGASRRPLPVNGER